MDILTKVPVFPNNLLIGSICCPSNFHQDHLSRDRVEIAGIHIKYSGLRSLRAQKKVKLSQRNQKIRPFIYRFGIIFASILLNFIYKVYIYFVKLKLKLYIYFIYKILRVLAVQLFLPILLGVCYHN